MEAKKNIQVVMLPTDEELKPPFISIRVDKYGDSDNHLTYQTNEFNGRDRPQHLHFTVDEKPEVGDWCVYFGTDIMKHDNNEVWDKDKCRKIIGTTDTKLKLGTCEGCKQDKDYRHFFIKCTCSLPQPSQAFIEKYCKVGGIWKVLVEYEEFIIVTQDDLLDSQNKAPKAWLPKVNSHNEITIHPIKDNWTRGEVTELLSSMSSYTHVHNRVVVGKELNNWVEENL